MEVGGEWTARIGLIRRSGMVLGWFGPSWVLLLGRRGLHPGEVLEFRPVLYLYGGLVQVANGFLSLSLFFFFLRWQMGFMKFVLLPPISNICQCLLAINNKLNDYIMIYEIGHFLNCVGVSFRSINF